MAFTPAEAELVLREAWTDASSVGGFTNACERQETIEGIEEVFGAGCLEGWNLIGHVGWSDYEEGGSYYLFIKEDDQSLWCLNSGSSVYGEYGRTFNEIEPTTIQEWLEEVQSCHVHAENFAGF